MLTRAFVFVGQDGLTAGKIQKAHRIAERLGVSRDACDEILEIVQVCIHEVTSRLRQPSCCVF